jgi:hypothetical protein
MATPTMASVADSSFSITIDSYGFVPNSFFMCKIVGLNFELFYVLPSLWCEACKILNFYIFLYRP